MNTISRTEVKKEMIRVKKEISVKLYIRKEIREKLIRDGYTETILGSGKPVNIKSKEVRIIRPSKASKHLEYGEYLAIGLSHKGYDARALLKMIIDCLLILRHL